MQLRVSDRLLGLLSITCHMDRMGSTVHELERVDQGRISKSFRISVGLPSAARPIL